MPYKDRKRQLAYQNEWMKRRRLDWISANGPCVDCGSWDSLEVDHKDAKLKVTHQVWSWAKERRDKELEKCVTRCHPCHVAKTVRMFEHATGTQKKNAKLREIDVCTIRTLHADGLRYKVLAKIYDMDSSTIGRICRHQRWKHI